MNFVVRLLIIWTQPLKDRLPWSVECGDSVDVALSSVYFVLQTVAMLSKLLQDSACTPSTTRNIGTMAASSSIVVRETVELTRMTWYRNVSNIRVIKRVHSCLSKNVSLPGAHDKGQNWISRRVTVTFLERQPKTRPVSILRRIFVPSSACS